MFMMQVLENKQKVALINKKLATQRYNWVKLS